MILRILAVGPLGTNCYLLGCDETRQAAVIDPGGDAELILSQASQDDLAIRYVIDTHGHADHIAANRGVVEATGAQLAIHRLDAPMLTDPALNLGLFMGQHLAGPEADLLLEEGDEIEVGTITLRVLHTPGHTPGGISLYSAAEGIVFSGDALFQRGIGRTDFPGGDHNQLLASIRGKLFALPDETIVYSGHGPETTIGEERRSNPWVR